MYSLENNSNSIEFAGVKMDIISIIDMFLKVNTFFNDTAKTKIWFSTMNPLLGGQSPIKMIQSGRSEKLMQFISDSLYPDGIK